MAKVKRWHYLINRKLQLKYAAMIGGVLIVMLFLVEYHTYLTIQSILPNILSSAIGRQIEQIHFWLIINGVIYMVVVIFVSIFISHKIAGPVYKMKKEIENIIQEGDLTKQFTIRKGDELTELVSTINVFIQDLKKRILNYDVERARVVGDIKNTLDSLDFEKMRETDKEKIKFIKEEINKLILPEKPLKV